MSISVTSGKLIVARYEKRDILHLCLLQITPSDLSEICGSKWSSALICIITLLDKDQPPLLGFSFTEKSRATYIIAFVTYVYAQRDGWAWFVNNEHIKSALIRKNVSHCDSTTVTALPISLSITLKATLWHGSWLDECPYSSVALTTVRVKLFSSFVAPCLCERHPIDAASYQPLPFLVASA